MVRYFNRLMSNKKYEISERPANGSYALIILVMVLVDLHSFFSQTTLHWTLYKAGVTYRW